MLAVLDSADVLPAINAQAAQVEVARTDFQICSRASSSVRRNCATKVSSPAPRSSARSAATEAADARVKAAQSQLANAQNGLAFQTLKADRDGVVVGVDAEAGSVVAAGQSVVRVAQLGEKELLVNVPERAVALMKQATVLAHLDAVPGKLYSAKLRELSPAADAASRTYTGSPQHYQRRRRAEARHERDRAPRPRRDASHRGAQHRALHPHDSTPRVWVVDRSQRNGARHRREAR